MPERSAAVVREEKVFVRIKDAVMRAEEGQL